MTESEELTWLIAERDRLQTELHQAAGQIKQCLQQIRQEFSCETLEEARALLSKKKREAELLHQQEQKLLEQMKDKYEELRRD